jgi:hypothetical protein
MINWHEADSLGIPDDVKTNTVKFSHVVRAVIDWSKGTITAKPEVHHGIPLMKPPPLTPTPMYATAV